MSFTTLQLLVLSCAAGHAAAAFTLDTSGPDWDYTTKDLANSTSQACKDAYSANIDCDDTLVSIVASMSPGFAVTTASLNSMCSTTCSDSLSDYVKNVKAACNKPGDLAQVASGNKGIPEAPVAVVGEVFQYAYAQSCDKNGNDYCRLDVDNNEITQADFACSDKCAVQFFKIAHDYPGSAYYFNYFYLCNQSPWWEDTFRRGYEAVVKCGLAENDTSSPSMSTSAEPTDVHTSTKLDTALLGETTMMSGYPTTSATPTVSSGAESTTPTAAGSRSGTAVGTATTSTATGGAARIRPFAGYF